MIHIEYFEEKDKSQWENYVLQNRLSSNGHLLGWKYAIEKTYPVKGHYLVALQDGAVVGMLPLFHIKNRYITDELTSLPYISYSGIIADTAEIASKLLRRAVQITGDLGARRLVLRQTKPLPEELHKTHTFSLEDQKIRMVLPLSSDPDELFNAFKAKLRSQVRRPEKEGMHFKMGGGELIDDFFDVFSRNMRDLGSPVHDKAFFTHLFTAMQERLRIGCVYFANRPVATGIIILHHDTVEIPWASTDRRYNRFSPNMLLYWSFIKFSCESGYSYFDFGRSTRDEGTHKFKMQWGSVEKPYYWYNFYRGEAVASDMPDQGKRKIIENVWSKLPLPLANYLGSKIRGYIPL